MAADFITGVWVDAVELSTVEVGIGIMGTVRDGVVGKGWAITLTFIL